MPHSNSNATNPPSVKNPMSNSSQASSHMGSPATQQPPPPQHPNSVGPSPMSGANMRLSHYDPPGNGGGGTSGPGSVGGMSSAPATPTAAGPKQQQTASSAAASTVSHLTSHSLEAMSKHVETLTSSFQPNQVQVIKATVFSFF
jgi:hypothetical protein